MCWRPKFSNFFNSFHNQVAFGTIFWRAFGISGGRGFEHPKPTPGYATATAQPPPLIKLKKSYSRNWQSLHSRTINLCFRLSHYEQPRLLECQHPTLIVSMRISCISLFFILGWWFACVRLLIFIVCYIMNTSYFRDRLNRLYFYVLAAHRVSDSKISVAIPSFH